MRKTMRLDPKERERVQEETKELWKLLGPMRIIS